MPARFVCMLVLFLFALALDVGPGLWQTDLCARQLAATTCKPTPPLTPTRAKTCADSGEITIKSCAMSSRAALCPHQLLRWVVLIRNQSRLLLRQERDSKQGQRILPTHAHFTADSGVHSTRSRCMK